MTTSHSLVYSVIVCKYHYSEPHLDETKHLVYRSLVIFFLLPHIFFIGTKRNGSRVDDREIRGREREWKIRGRCKTKL